LNAAVLINFLTSIVTLTVGILVLTGSFFPPGSATTTYLFGFVLIAYGVYRFVNTFSRIRQNKNEERLRKLEEERDKLLGGN